MSDKQNRGLQELIKDLECLTIVGKERTPSSLDPSFFEAYTSGFREGLEMSLELAKRYLKGEDE